MSMIKHPYYQTLTFLLIMWENKWLTIVSHTFLNKNNLEKFHCDWQSWESEVPYFFIKWMILSQPTFFQYSISSLHKLFFLLFIFFIEVEHNFL